jgi:hypothetical protein
MGFCWEGGRRIPKPPTRNPRPKPPPPPQALACASAWKKHSPSSSRLNSAGRPQPSKKAGSEAGSDRRLPTRLARRPLGGSLVILTPAWGREGGRCVCVCLRACVRACVCVCVRACVVEASTATPPPPQAPPHLQHRRREGRAGVAREPQAEAWGAVCALWGIDSGGAFQLLVLQSRRQQTGPRRLLGGRPRARNDAASREGPAGAGDRARAGGGARAPECVVSGVRPSQMRSRAGIQDAARWQFCGGSLGWVRSGVRGRGWGAGQPARGRAGVCKPPAAGDEHTRARIAASSPGRAVDTRLQDDPAAPLAGALYQLCCLGALALAQADRLDLRLCVAGGGGGAGPGERGAGAVAGTGSVGPAQRGGRGARRRARQQGPWS